MHCSPPGGHACYSRLSRYMNTYLWRALRAYKFKNQLSRFGGGPAVTEEPEPEPAPGGEPAKNLRLSAEPVRSYHPSGTVVVEMVQCRKSDFLPRAN